MKDKRLPRLENVYSARLARSGFLYQCLSGSAIRSLTIFSGQFEVWAKDRRMSLIPTLMTNTTWNFKGSSLGQKTTATYLTQFYGYRPLFIPKTAFMTM